MKLRIRPDLQIARLARGVRILSTRTALFVRLRRHAGRRDYLDLGSMLNVPIGLSITGNVLSTTVVPDVYTLRVSASKTPVRIELRLGSELILETHGHCLAVYDANSVKLAEALVKSAGPVSVREVTSFRRLKGAQSQAVQMSTNNLVDELSVTIRSGSFQMRAGKANRTKSHWQRWHGTERSLTYLVDEPKSALGRTRLIVVFSAIGSEFSFSYNYRTTLSDVDAYRIYLLDDFGHRGSYYYADHQDESIFRSVQEFLADQLAELGVDLSRTIFAGSSKGGTAALIHGFALGVGEIVAGAPQSKPGTYLAANAPEMLEFIAGNSGDDGQRWLDAAITRVLSAGKNGTQVRLLVGEKDHHHLNTHVAPLLKIMEQRNASSVSTLIIQDVDHQDIGRPFGAYLKHLVTASENTTNVLIPYALSWVGGNRAQLTTWLPKNELISVRAYCGKELIYSNGYSGSGAYEFPVPQGKSVRVRIYRMNATSKKLLGAFTTKWLRPQGGSR